MTGVSLGTSAQNGHDKQPDNALHAYKDHDSDDEKTK